MRLLTAIFTTRPSGMLHEPISMIPHGQKINPVIITNPVPNTKNLKSMDITSLLALIVPRLQAVFPEQERIASTASSISASVISPAIHTKTFPGNMKPSIMELWKQLGKAAGATKIWRKDVADAFNHPRIFSMQHSLARGDWLHIIRQWVLTDRGRVEELLARVTAPTTAGIMFGVGASAARLDADKKTQLNLRRVAVVLLAMEPDYVVPYMPTVLDKLNEMLSATVSSSPSSSTRADVYMLLQAVVLRTSPLHQAPMWPLVHMELQKVLTSVLSRSAVYDMYNGLALLQACKLLDLLVILAPEDFQMHEWIFITDTIDSVYHPDQWDPVALVDEITEDMGSSAPVQSPNALNQDTALETTLSENRNGGFRTLLLDVKDNASKMGKDEIVAKILRPFFAQLSIHAYEATYSMEPADAGPCEEALLQDIFDDATIVG